jgi:hypothetical protein
MWWRERQVDQTGYEEAEKHLGFVGCILSASKKAPEVIWNANVCTREHGKIWYGDISIAKSKKALQELANKLGTNVYVLREMDARFDTEDKPRFDNAVEIIEYEHTV